MPKTIIDFGERTDARLLAIQRSLEGIRDVLEHLTVQVMFLTPVPDGAKGGVE